MGNDPIVIAFCVSDSFIRHTAVVIASVLASNPGERFVFHVLCGDLSQDSRTRLGAMAGPRADVVFHDVTSGEAEGCPVLMEHLSREAYFRYLIPELIEAIQSELRSRNLSLAVDTLTASGQFPDCASPKNCDGIIYHSAPQDPEIIKRFWKFRPKVPSVWTFRDHIDSGNLLDHIFYNNAMVGEIAAKYLFSRNCRNVVLFNACPEHTAYKERKATFFASCIKLGMHVTELAPRNSRKNVDGS